MTEETKRKIGKAHKGKKHSAMTLKKIAATKRGVAWTPEAIKSKRKIMGWNQLKLTEAELEW